MAFILFILNGFVDGNTGSSVQLSQQSCSVPVNLVTELQTLRNLLNKESEMLLELQRDFYRLSKNHDKTSQDYQRLERKYTQIMLENQNLAAEIDAIRYNVSNVKAESEDIGQSQQLTSAAVTDLAAVVRNKMTGAVFTRWGRTTCPANTSELVYTGTYDNNLVDMFVCVGNNTDMLVKRSSINCCNSGFIQYTFFDNCF